LSCGTNGYWDVWLWGSGGSELAITREAGVEPSFGYQRSVVPVTESIM
jgi:hypothetical protein